MAMIARPLKYLVWWRVLGRVLVVAMLALALAPAPAVVGAVPFGDKVGHVCGFAALMLWYAQIYGGTRERLRCALGAVAFGLAIELAQALTTYRSAEFADLVADALGVALGWLLARGPLGDLFTSIERRVPA
jgi:VanZ family protein